MPLHQPFVHDLAGVFAAPIQAWSTLSGAMTGNGAEGVFLADDRLISAYALEVRGALGDESGEDLPSGELSPVGTRTIGANRTEFTDIVSLENMPADPLVRLERVREATTGGIRETLTVTSAADVPATLELRLTLGLDASPMAAVKDPHLAEKLAVAAPTPTVSGLAAEWSWREHTEARLSIAEADGRSRLAAATTSEGGPALALTFRATVNPGTSASFAWALDAQDTAAPFTGVNEPSLVNLLPEDLRRESDLAVAGSVRDSASRSEKAAVGRLLTQSLADLSSLRLARTGNPAEAFLAAGAPWFFTLFGRDSLIAASFLAPLDRDLAERTVRTLATQQGERVDVETAEQPGKILHEVRAVGMDMGESFLPPVYYGTIDATGLWLQLVGDLARAGSDLRDLTDNVARAAEWLLEHADADGDFFLEYIDESGHGLANQGWKDSGDSVRFADGRIAEGPIALAEVQGYAYEASLTAAELLETWKHPRSGDLAPRLRERAEQIRAAFREQFWVEDAKGRYVALALDGTKTPVDSVASNMGHLLGTGLLDAAEERLVMDRLMDPTMFSGYGIRTLSSDNGAYWPTRYHGGSVWTHDSAFVLRQALRAGFVDEAQQIARALLRAADGFSLRLPELFAGDPSTEVYPPLPYPASCRPQAWAAASAVPIAQALGYLKG